MNYIIFVVFLVLGVSFRLVPHAPNFTPILSIALLSGFYIKNKYSILLPIGIMLLSDSILGGNPMGYWIYASIVSIILLGFFVKNNAKNIFINSVLSSMLFFIITNFGVWFAGGYSFTLVGFVECYVLAIPFFRNTLMSTVFFSMFIYCLHYLINSMLIKYQENI